MSITGKTQLIPQSPLHCNFLDSLSFELHVSFCSLASPLYQNYQDKESWQASTLQLRNFLTNRGHKVDSVQ
ncbi:hypothetical protein N665_1120s0009 [Sinapis alba]|nr:hypothetical protein N665_1120s0009 [Sinapis alba]